MVDEAAEARIAAAREAYRAGLWDEARDSFTAAVAAGRALDPEDLDSLGYAELLLGEPSLETLEGAFEAYETAGRVHDAARVAIDLASAYAARNLLSRAMGWARQAERVIEGHAEGPGHANLVLLHAFFAAVSGRAADALELVERGYELARRHGDTDAEARALNQRARILIRVGRTEEAKGDLDEAMLLVQRGRVRPISGAVIFCNTIDVCRDLSDFERALEWTEAATAWITERRVFCFPGVCRVHHAELLRMRGEHERAESEARAALGLFERMQTRGMMGPAFAEIGYQRLELGDLEGAEAAFGEAHEAGHEPMPGTAILRLRRSDPASALAMLETALEERRQNPLGRAVLLPTVVEACLGLGDVERAADAARELAEAAELIGTIGLRASAGTAAARVHLARGEAQRAVVAARAATRAWNFVGACYELSRAREVLAAAYAAAGDSVRAKMEEEAAHAARGPIASGATIARSDVDRPRVAAVEPRAFTAPSIHEGAVIDDKIEVGPVLGAGGMGIVHAGRHRLTGREVAIKVLKRRLCGGDPHCARFLREALACGRIRHPNVVDIYDAGTYGSEPYIVMERLAGEPLSNRMERSSRLEVAEALSIAEQAARGVAAAHAVGIVHRDLKPANIFVDEPTEGSLTTKVLDFGLSKLPDTSHTRTGELMGTPFYMAPEQINAPTTVDERTDVYALGAVLFEMLAGRPPFVAEVLPALMYAILHGPMPDLAAERPDVPKTVVDIVHCALSRDAGARFASAELLADTLAAVSL